MKRLDYILVITFVALSSLLIGLVMPAKTRLQPASAATSCPVATADGAYFERGKDDQGNAICGFAYYNACPYADGYSVNDPICAKFADQQKPVQQLTPQEPVTANQYEGK